MSFSVAGKYFELSSFTLNTETWVPIIVAIPCHRVVIENTDQVNPIYFRTAEGGAQKTILQGSELDINAETITFNPGDIIGECLASAGTGPVVASFTR